MLCLCVRLYCTLYSSTLKRRLKVGFFFFLGGFLFFSLLELCAALSRATGSRPKQRQRHQRKPKGCLFSEMQKSGRMITTRASICSSARCQCKWLQAAGETDKLTTIVLISTYCSPYCICASLSLLKIYNFRENCICILLNIFSFVAAASVKGCVWIFATAILINIFF